MELAGLRAEVAFVQAEHGLSERRACKLLEVDRSTYDYEPTPDRKGELSGELVQLARQKPPYGYRRLHVHPKAHEQTVLNFTPRSSPPRTVPLFADQEQDN